MPHERITMLLENQPYPQDPRVHREAESLVGAGHTVEVVAPRRKGQPARERVNGVEVRRYRAVNLPQLGALGLLLEYLVAAIALHAAALRALARGATVLHLHNPPDMFFAAGAIFRLAGRRVIFDHHDLGPELTEVKFGPGALHRAALIGERLTFAVATDVVAANESHAEIARARGHKRADRVTVVRNGPPPSWTRLPLALRPGALSLVRLAYVGSVGVQDGLDGMASVLACLRELAPELDAELTVIGDGDARAQFEHAANSLGVAASVKLLGWVPAGEVAELLQDADVCVDPAPPTPLNERSTMIKLMEYMALGKPVVAYDLLETRRTLGDAGLLVTPDDPRAFAEQIAVLARDGELRSRLATCARERARALTWDRSEIALLDTYAGLRNGRRGALRSSLDRARWGASGTL